MKKLTGVRDLKKILETTVKDIADSFNADICQIMLSSPLDGNVTSICEYKQPGEDDYEGMQSFSLPLNLHGRTLGSLSLNRHKPISREETDNIRVILGELNDIIRHAQINDVVQRDTFRETFLLEIANVMAYSLGIGDALFMVVNILGKVLQASRCLFICTDDAQGGWKCFEFWQQEKVQSCQDYRWPTTDSPVIAQTLFSAVPLAFFDGQLNSYVSPVQEELQFIGVKSLLGIRLRSSESTHGCVILQQCDYRRAWTRNEIDMVQNVADKVAEALFKLSPEKRTREPIMQLHQRIVAPTVDNEGDGSSKMENVRRALKGALGQQAIPSARKIQPAPKPAEPRPNPKAEPKSASPQSAPPVTAEQPLVDSAPLQSAQPYPIIPPVQTAPQSLTSDGEHGGQTNVGGLTGSSQENAEIKSFQPQISGGRSLAATPGAALARVADPFADLDFGDLDEEEPASFKSADPNSTLGGAVGDAQPIPPAAAVSNSGTAIATSEISAAVSTETATPAPAGSASPRADLDAIAAPASTGSALPRADLDAIATPSPAGSPSSWGNLDAIATPASAPARGLGGGAMLGKARANSASRPIFNKGRAAASSEPVAVPETKPAEPLDEAAAQAKLQQLMNATNETSDYVFATSGLDMRMLGRIDSWIAEVEAKDGFKNGHVRQTAEYAMAIGRECGLDEKQMEIIRQAALLHDVGKLGSSSALLRKSENELADEELLLVMKHPIAGAELLQSFPDLRPLVPIVLAHREEYDGEGYPQGLSGEQIPLEARVLAVANGYHCLVSEMKYGPGMSPGEAQQKMVEEAGKKYDPRFVQALLQAILSKKVPAS